MMNSYPLIILMGLVLSGFSLLLLKTSRSRSLVSLEVQAFCLVTALGGQWYVSQRGSYVLTAGPYEAPWGITLNIGPTEALLAALFLSISAAITWYGIFSLEREIPPHRLVTYQTLSHLSLAAVLGILFTGDLFNSFVFLEVSSLSACGMTIVKDRNGTVIAALKYLILSSLGSGLVLMGIAYLYAITGHLNLHAIHEALIPVSGQYPAMILISLALFLTGLGLKSAIFPLHIWLPDVYEGAPTPSSAFFSSLVSKAPAILLIKLFYGVFGFTLLNGTPIPRILLVLGAAGMLTGSLIARRQVQLKRMIAYSSVAQMGYVFLGIGLGTPWGVTLGIYHMVAHSLSKACIFLAAGSFIEQTGQTAIRAFRGIGRKMPHTLGLFTLCALSMVGIPLLPGFISKFNLALAAIGVGKPILLGVILLSSLLNATYYFPVIINGYFGEDNLRDRTDQGHRKPLRELAPLIALCSLMILAGFLSGPILELLKNGFYTG